MSSIPILSFHPSIIHSTQDMLVKTFGAAVQGVDAQLITIEVNVGKGEFGYTLVGLPDNAIKESSARIFTSIRNNGLESPRTKVTINLAPADVRKEGSAYDLPIALGILAAGGAISAERVGEYMILGELSLDGSLRPIKGALPISMLARKLGFKGFILPRQNASEAAIVNRPGGHPYHATCRDAAEFPRRSPGD
jgi:magnesium chelatase family protein